MLVRVVTARHRNPISRPFRRGGDRRLCEGRSATTLPTLFHSLDTGNEYDDGLKAAQAAQEDRAAVGVNCGRPPRRELFIKSPRRAPQRIRRIWMKPNAGLTA